MTLIAIPWEYDHFGAPKAAIVGQQCLCPLLIYQSIPNTARNDLSTALISARSNVVRGPSPSSPRSMVAHITIATLLMFHKLGLPFFGVLSWFFLALLTLIMVVLLIRTALAVRRREICVEES